MQYEMRSSDELKEEEMEKKYEIVILERGQVCVLKKFIRIVLTVFNVHLRFVAILESIWLTNLRNCSKDHEHRKLMVNDWSY